MKVLIFGFKGTIAEKVVTAMNLDANKFYLDSSEDAIQALVNTASLEQYDYILGLGAYSGQDKAKLRIETICSSQFRNAKTNLRHLAIPYFLQPAAGIALASGIGTSWCNLVSYRILLQSPSVAYAFVHIPKAFSPNKAARILDQQLTAIGAS